MTEKLKPCPFCGSDDLEIRNRHYVECLNCETFGPAPDKPMASWRTDNAVEAWNRRAKDEKPSGSTQSIDQPVDYPTRPQESGAEGRDAQTEAQALEECIYQRVMLTLGVSGDGGAGK